MGFYRKKPVVIQAVRFTEPNFEEIEKFMGLDKSINSLATTLAITTLEGVMTASLGDFIIKGINGELYPCKPDIFYKTYEII